MYEEYLLVVLKEPAEDVQRPVGGKIIVLSGHRLEIVEELARSVILNACPATEGGDLLNGVNR